MQNSALAYPDAFTMSRPAWLRDAAAISFWCAVWIALWKLAEILAVNFGVSAWYPPAAISLFLMIRYGPPAAGAVFVASLLAGSAQWQGYPTHHAVLGSLGHAVAYFAAAQSYRARLDRHRFSLRPRSVASLLLAALIGAGLSSVIGNVNLHVASGDRSHLDFPCLLGWAVGDLFGCISLCPLLLFARPRLRWSRAPLRRLWSLARVPAAALAAAIALASAFAVIAGGSDLDFRLLSVVGVGVYSVIVAYLASPRSSVIYLSVIAVIAAAWLSTELAPAARIEFALQTITFLIASYVMIVLTMERTKARVAAMTRRLRIRDLSAQHDALSGRIAAIETEFTRLAHEFKTPLGGILGLVDVTEHGVAQGDGREQMARHLKQISGCARYLNAMVDDAFDIARIARGQFAPAIAEFDVLGLLDELDTITRSKVGGEVAFRTDVGVERLQVRSDRNRLLQILINLVVNGVRYADRRRSVVVTCAVDRETVTITVENPSKTVTKAEIDGYIAGGRGIAANSIGLGIGLPLVGKLAAGIGAQLTTAVCDGVVRISVTVARA